jgi:hypothetical protein
MSETQGRASRPPIPSYLRAPRLADQLIAALLKYLASDLVDRSDPMGAAHADTIADFVTETEPFGTGVRTSDRPRAVGSIDTTRTGTGG